MLDRLVTYLYPVQGRTDDHRSRGVLMIIGLVGGSCLSVAAAIAFLAWGAPGQAGAASFGVVCCALGAVSLRASRSLHVATNVLAIGMTLSLGTATVLTGDLSRLTWLGIVPVAALLFSNIKQATAWLVINTAVIAGIGAFLLQYPLQLARVLPLVQQVIFLFAVFGLTLAFEVGRQRTQRALEVARDEANRANALKSEFLASFSHEIRTPLNGVLGTTDALLASKLPPEVHEQLLIIQRSGSSLLRTINDVLELSRIEAGRLDLFPVNTDLPRLLDEVVALFRARAAVRKVALRLELAPGHPRHVKVDDLRLRQVVQNLVGNAVKFTEQGEVCVRLATGISAGGHVLTRISISDTGPGIAAEAAAQLFAAFTQARPRTDRVEGTGLGLAISKQFIDLMDGKLTVDTAPGRGSTFTIELTLPLAEEPLATPSPNVLPVPPGPPARRLTLLVVDDNEINLKVAVSLLNRLGHQTLVARDGAQALSAIAAHQPDVVFMDCHMPGIDGLEATRRLRASGDGRPVVAVTASVYAEDRERCRAAGMNHFVSKPVSLQSFQEALAEVDGRAMPLPAAQPAPKVAGRRVLVVDDDPQVRRMTVRLLRTEGFEVDDAADVEGAMLHFTNAAPDCLVVDQVLGGTENGLRFAERMHSQKKDLRVVVISGCPPSDDELSVLLALGGQFLAKPYNRKSLIACIH